MLTEEHFSLLRVGIYSYLSDFKFRAFTNNYEEESTFIDNGIIILDLNSHPEDAWQDEDVPNEDEECNIYYPKTPTEFFFTNTRRSISKLGSVQQISHIYQQFILPLEQQNLKLRNLYNKLVIKVL